MSLEIDLPRELPDVAKAMELVRDDAVYEARGDTQERRVPWWAAIALCVAWVGACVAVGFLFGASGWVLALIFVGANMAEIVAFTSGKYATKSQGKTFFGNPQSELAKTFNRFRLLFYAASVLWLPLLLVVLLSDDAAERKSLGNRAGRALDIVADPRWPDLRRLWTSLELYNLSVETRKNFDLAKLVEAWADRCDPEARAMKDALDAHAAIAVPLLRDARNLMAYRPFGKAIDPPPADFSEQICALEIAERAVLDARGRLLGRIHELSQEGLA